MAELDDIPVVASLVALHAGGEPVAWASRVREDIDREDRYLIVAEDEGEVVGYGRIHHFQAPPDAPPNVAPDGYYLGGLVIAPLYRETGIGAALTGARLRWIADRAPVAWYFANARNRRSLRLHERLGFREITRDFVFPGVTFDGGVGVLSCAELSRKAGWPQLAGKSE